MTTTEEDAKEQPKTLCAANISPAIHAAQYAVRGAIVRRANELVQELKNANNDNDNNNAEDTGHKYPFKDVIFCNIGNPQAFIQPPITFHRQVLACLVYPPLMEQSSSESAYDNSRLFPSDVIARAQKLLAGTRAGSIGAYTTSQGLFNVRQSVAEFIERRDGFPSDPSRIFLSAGASPSIKHVLQCLGYNKSHGILVPIPQYPLYSASITLNNTTIIGYALDESNDWAANLESIGNAIAKARQENIEPRAIVVINPGNPTGQCMTVECINGILQIAHKQKLVVLADEVYQENIYDTTKYPFVSFKKCLMSMADAAVQTNTELISFHSVSKGIFGECGLRGGYMELTNISAEATAILLKLQSINLCPNVVGQCMVDLMVNPPKAGDVSHATFLREYEAQYASLKERANIISTSLNLIDGISCNTIFGAMYAFPRIHLSEDVVRNVGQAYADNADCAGKSACFIYCWELLESTGVCVVPGSGFRQQPNTYHFRTTLLPPKPQIEYCCQAIAKFHKQFVDKYQ